MRLISTRLVLIMLVEVVPANLLGGWILRASAAEVPADLGFAGLPQPEPLPTTAEVEAPPTVIVDAEITSPPPSGDYSNQISVAAETVEEGIEITEDENLFDYDAPYTLPMFGCP